MSQNLKPTFGIYFNSKKCQYMDNKFTDIDLFRNKLIELLQYSAPINNIIQYSPNIYKEIQCLKRLETICNNYNLIYKRNTTNGNPIDVYINEYSVQVKYCESDYLNNSITFSLKKSGGKKDGKSTSIPYDVNDNIDYYIFEYGGENGKYLSQFCILSKEFMIENKYISTETTKGKVKIQIWKPNTITDKIGTSKFWNKFNLFYTKK
jgi:hypothetical protein